MKSSPPVPQSSPPLLRYWLSNGAESDGSGIRSFGQRALGKGGEGCTHSGPVPGPSILREPNRNNNKYRHSHKAAL